MSFLPVMMKKKKYKFNVDLLVEELSSVSLGKGTLFSKVRLLDGGTYSEVTPRVEIQGNEVRWGTRFNFACKMSASATTGILENCICRISVRKEVKGGRTFQKLGFADLNLAEYAGAGSLSRRYLLEGYDTKNRQDNSILKIILEMTLLSGDPCFKSQSFQQPALLREPDDHFTVSVASGTSDFGSLTRNKQGRPAINTECVISEIPEDKDDQLQKDFEAGHSRNSSYASQTSKASGYSSMHSHSRQGSSESGHFRNLSSGSGYSDVGSLKQTERKRPSAKKLAEENRMDKTRVDADKLIDDLLKATNLEDLEKQSSPEDPGLELYVREDGTMALGSRDGKNPANYIEGSFRHTLISRIDEVGS